MPQVRGHHDAGVIVIVSCAANEKGGTFKTHITANLVCLLDGHAHLIPDLHKRQNLPLGLCTSFSETKTSTRLW